MLWILYYLKFLHDQKENFFLPWFQASPLKKIERCFLLTANFSRHCAECLAWIASLLILIMTFELAPLGRWFYCQGH